MLQRLAALDLVHRGRQLGRWLNTTGWIEVRPDVRTALKEGRGVVALESTIITHGLSWPTNLIVAQNLEQCIRDKGCVAATIAVMDGKIRVGLSKEELERVAMAGRNGTAIKCSKRDIAAVAALDRGMIGATTVGATVTICGLSGISVFATGGIGGAHRPTTSLDISNDLIELGRHPVAVVCAGCKSVLDVEATLEILETQGVAVFGFGTHEFQTFFTSSSLPAPLRADNAADIARWLRATQALGLSSGAVVAVPHMPEDSSSLQQIHDAVARATAEPDVPKGKHATPWLLKRIAELSGGASVRENVALVMRNASVAADVANALHDDDEDQLACFGASALDVHVTDNVVRTTPGGVAWNVAEAARRAGLTNVTLVSVDMDKPVSVSAPNVEAFQELSDDYSTALVTQTELYFRGNSRRHKPRVAIVEADLPAAAIDIITMQALPEVWFDPSTPAKGARLFPKVCNAVDLIAPNLDELDAMLASRARISDLGEKCRALSRLTSRSSRILLTLGDQGCLFLDRSGNLHRLQIHEPVKHVVSPIGAGDTLLGVTAAAWVHLFNCNEFRFPDAIKLGMRAAALSVQSAANVPEISLSWLYREASSLR